MVADLHQNPLKRPICGSWLPALLRQGCMFLVNIHAPASAPEERWLLDSDPCLPTYIAPSFNSYVICQCHICNTCLCNTLDSSQNQFLTVSIACCMAEEHLHAMGARQFPPAKPNNDDDPFPVFTYQAPTTVCKRLAGNVI